MYQNHERNLRMLPNLKETLRKIENDHDKTPSLLELRRLLIERIKEIERQMKQDRDSAE